MTLPPNPDVKGFLADSEGEFLHGLALQAAPEGPILEIGSYCGRSTIWLAAAAKQRDTVVFALDHHRGSEEHQIGEFFHDSDLVDATGRFDSLPAFRQNIADAGLEPWVIALVGANTAVGRFLSTDFSMVFIDGGHSLDAAINDWNTFGTRVAPGGILAIHDVFPDSGEGGQAPYTVWRMALDSGLYEAIGQQDSLRALRRRSTH